MPKQKSSATSGTRKKHARKAAANQATDAADDASNTPQPSAKGPKGAGGKGKGKKKGEPRVKMYIPPVKPPALQRDPVEVYALASRLPPDLLVIFRKLTKKDIVTRTRALEELQGKWVDVCAPQNSYASDEDRDGALAGLEIALPAWNVHFPALMFHSSRRIRLLTAQIQASCLQIPSLCDQIVDYIPVALETYCGAWQLSRFDIDRQVSQVAQQSWKQVASLPLPEDEEGGRIEARAVPQLISFTIDSVMAPDMVYTRFYPGTGIKSFSHTDDVDQNQIDEGEDESPSDRAGRIRLAALGSLRSLIESGLVTLSHTTDNEEYEERRIESLLNDPQFWTILYFGDRPPFASTSQSDSVCFGLDQPGVRRAGWSLVQVLAKHHYEHLGSAVPVMSAAILRSIWVEPDAGTRVFALDGLLGFIAAFPEAWRLAATFSAESDSEETEDTDGHAIYSNPAYIEFLQFLRMACGGSPSHFYPSIIIIISKLSTELPYRTQSSIEELFDALWAAVDSQALTIVERGSAPVLAFISAVLENARFVSTKLRQLDPSGEVEGSEVEMSSQLVVQQIGRVWYYYTSRKLVTKPAEFGAIMCRTLDRLAGTNVGKYTSRFQLFKIAWTRIEAAVTSLFEGDGVDTLAKVDLANVWKSIDANAKDAVLKEQLHALLIRMLSISLRRLEEPNSSPIYLDHLILMMTDLKSVVVGGGAEQELLKSLLIPGVTHFDGKMDSSSLGRLIEACLFYLQGDLPFRQKYWHNTLTVLSNPSDAHKSTLRALLHVSEQGGFLGLSSTTTELHSLVLAILSGSRDGSHQDDQLLLDLIRNHDIFLSEAELDVCANFVCSWLEEISAGVLRQTDYSTTSGVLFAIQILQQLHEVAPEIVVPRRATFAGPLFVLKYILSRTSSESEISVDATVYSKLIGGAEGFQAWLPELQSWLLDPQVIIDVDILVDSLLEASHQDSEWLLQKVVPSRTVLDKLFMEEVLLEPSSILAVADPLISEEEEEEEEEDASHIKAHDSKHPSSYARLVWALSSLMAIDRHLARSNYWVLKHLLLIQQLAEDRLSLPARSSRDAFGSEMARGTVQFILDQARTTIAYLLSSGRRFSEDEDEISHTRLVQMISGKVDGGQVGLPETMQAVTVEVCRLAQKKDCVRLARLVRTLLGPILRGASGVDIDVWLTFARATKRSCPHLARGVAAAAVSTGLETPLLTRMRNEAASDLIGLPVSRANTEGANHLRTLLVLAPPVDSDSVLLPAQRSVNLVHTVEKWISSGNEEEDEEEVGMVVESRMIALFVHLAPILQSLSGRHWEFAFDLIENTLEGVSFKDSEMFVQLARTLDLVSVVQTLITTNKQLRAVWSTRQKSILRLVRDLVVSTSAHQLDGGLELIYRNKSLSVLQGNAEDALEADDFSKLVYLLQEPHLETQQEGYALVRTAAHKYTERVVMEAGLNVSASSTNTATTASPDPIPAPPSEGVDIRLPEELIQILGSYGILEIDENDAREGEDGNEDLEEWRGFHQRQFGFFLGWMALFDAMENTTGFGQSLKVRAGYVEQIRNGSLVSLSLIPTLCRTLRLGRIGAATGASKKPVRLDLWEVDAFYVELYEPSSVHVLAAHIYYRALRAIPSLVRTWWMDCKDRQLSNAVGSYTSSYFSPVLLSAELAGLRSQAPSSQTGMTGSGSGGGRETLEDEATSVRVTMSGQGVWEVNMTYTIDEQKMEMGMRLPGEYPLKNIELKDGRRVGVPENKWRGWLFAVQQVVSAQ
ncbi:hypothetical protein FRC17_005213, partial [Serendipita sp. 399]